MPTLTKMFHNLQSQECGARFLKVDLHIHTPGSADATGRNKYGFKYNSKKHTKQDLKKLAQKIVQTCIENGIRLIALTDHNSPGYVDTTDLRSEVWYRLIKEAARGKPLTVLPGVEISTSGAHILIILPPHPSHDEYNIFHIESLLEDYGFNVDKGDYGNLKATGTKSIIETIQLAGRKKAIAIPAHLDGGGKSLFERFKKPCQTLVNLMQQPNVNAVEIVKTRTKNKRFANSKKSKQTLKEYFDKNRTEHRYPVAFLQNSDAHSLKEIGRRFSYIRMDEPDFSSLQNALDDPETRVKLKEELPKQNTKTYILGMILRKKKTVYIKFNENLNCIIGKLGMGKSTLIKLLIDTLGQLPEPEPYLKNLKYTVSVFIKKEGPAPEYYCFSKTYRDKKPKIFKYVNGRFVELKGKPEGLALPKNYNSEVILDRIKDADSLMEFIKKRFHLDLKNKKSRKKFNNMYKDKNGKPVLLVEYKRNRLTLNLIIDKKKKGFSRLSAGERNVVTMLLLLKQDSFGPMIIDEPERHLDSQVLSKFLISRLRELKTKQQIISVTQDPNMLLLADAENVIILEPKFKVKCSGGIYKKSVKKEIISVLEGSKDAFLKRKLKYDF